MFYLVMISLCMLTAGYADDEEMGTMLRVVSFEPVGGDNSFFLQTKVMRSPEKQSKVRTSSSTLLPPIKYHGSRTLTLMLHVSDKLYRPVARVQLSPSYRRTIVLLLPATKGSKLKYQAVAMNGDLKAFKPGSRRLVNLSKFPLRGELGSKPFKRGSAKNIRFLCKPKKMVDVPVLDPKARVLASQPVILEYYGVQKKWNVLTSTRWFHTPTQRHLIFVYFDPQRKNLILRGVSDTVAADLRDIAGNQVEKEKKKDDDAAAQRESARRHKKAKGPQQDPRR